MRMERQVRAQLRTDLGRSSKVINDREGIEAVVEVPGAGELVLRVESAGGCFSREGRVPSLAQSSDRGGFFSRRGRVLVPLLIK